MRMLDVALAYAKAGIPVFPCRRNKAPLTPQGFKDATTDPATVEQYWTKFHGASIGIRTGNGLVVLDVDPRNGGDQSLVQLGPLPRTWEAQTGGGGRHFYFRTDNPVASAKLDRAGLPGLDIKAEGGYVIAPPSSHESGARYEWVNPPDGEIAPLPDGIRSLIGEAKETPSEAIAEGRIPAGRRDDALHRLGSWLARVDFSAEEISDLLDVINQSRCDPPKSRRDLDRIARSVRRYDEEEINPLDLPSVNLDDALVMGSDLLAMEAEEPEWLLPGFICRGDVHLLAAGPGVGKSMITLSLLASLASGQPIWHTLPALEPMRCLYVDAENNKNTIIRRLTGICDIIGIDADAVGSNIGYLFGRGWAAFGDPVYEKKMLRRIREYQPDIIVLDSFVALASTRTENDAREVRKFFTEKIFPLARELDATIIVLHHTNKSSYRQEQGVTLEKEAMIRGSVDILGAVDSWSYLYHPRNGQPGLSLAAGKVRDAEAPPDMSLIKVTNRWAFVPEAHSLAKPPSFSSTLLQTIREASEPLTLQALLDHTGLSKTTLRRQLAQLVKEGLIVQQGDGSKGLPFTYAFASES